MVTGKKAALILRIPEELRRKLAREAKKANRSLNEEMRRRLEHSLELSYAEAHHLTVVEVLRGAEEFSARAIRAVDDAKKIYEEIEGRRSREGKK